MLIEAESPDMLSALARCRQTVLERANVLLNPANDAPPGERADALPGVTALLMASLEELKVAEEELRQQNATLVLQRSVVDQRLQHYRQLFLHSPAPAFISDLYGTIQEANVAAAKVFRREARHLERKPIAALLPAGQRDVFRRRLATFLEETDTREWPLTFNRVGDTPIEARAVVTLVPELGPTRSGLLYWMLQLDVAKR